MQHNGFNYPLRLCCKIVRSPNPQTLTLTLTSLTPKTPNSQALIPKETFPSIKATQATLRRTHTDNDNETDNWVNTHSSLLNWWFTSIVHSLYNLVNSTHSLLNVMVCYCRFVWSPWYVCVSLSLYIYIYMHIYIYIHSWYVCICRCMCMYVCMCMYICMYIYIYI